MAEVTHSRGATMNHIVIQDDRGEWDVYGLYVVIGLTRTLSEERGGGFETSEEAVEEGIRMLSKGTWRSFRVEQTWVPSLWWGAS